MKITVEYIASGEDEIVLKCRQLDSKMQRILSFIEESMEKMVVQKGYEKFLLQPDDVFYVEAVDNKTFVYTKDAVLETQDTLNNIENKYYNVGLIRIGKSQLVNLNHIKKLKSISNSRIEVTLESDERLVVSRHYARMFKSRLGLDN
ncbi:MAG: LytTR family transcriptional regulator [Clostridiales bacterium]|nr:LytTR family transcriptional regulator [Clostridiales bacterium]